MTNKNSFILQTRLNSVVAKLSDKQAGVLFKSILNYAANGTQATFEDSAVDIVFEMVRQDLDYAAKKYAETCARRAESGKLGGRPKKANESKKSKCFFEKANESKQKHNDNDVDNDIHTSINTCENNKQLTSAKSADVVVPKKLNNLQIFSNEVLKNFEPDVHTDGQIAVWFKRNCRCLSDILKFCENDIPLAIRTIDVCIRWLDERKLTGGYEAVLRHIPEFCATAKKELEVEENAEKSRTEQ